MVNNDTRHNAPDIMKGILILCVVFGHSLSMVNSIQNVPWSQSIVNVFFTSFEMPGFSLLSGYFLAFSLEHRSICQVLKRRLFRYLPVLLIWCAVPIIIKAFSHLPAFSIRNICIDIIDSISSGKLWYIFSYIFCTTLFCLFLIIETKITKREIKIIFRILGCIMLLVFIHTSPVSFGYSTYLLPFFFVGYIMRIILNKHSSKIGKVNRTVAIIGSMLFPILLFFYKADYSFYLCDQNILSYTGNLASMIHAACIYIMRFFCALCGCCFIYNSSCALSGESIAAKILSKIGKKSLQIYILSVHLQILLCKVLGKLISGSTLTDFNVVFSIGVLFFIVLLITTEITRRIIVHIPIIGKMLIGE